MSSRLPDDRVSVLDRVDAVGRYFGQCTGRRYAEPFVSFGPLAVGRIELLGDIVKADGLGDGTADGKVAIAKMRLTTPPA